MRIREYAPLCLTTGPGRSGASRGWARIDAAVSMHLDPARRQEDLYNSVRIAHKSGKSGRPIVSRRYSAPLVPPVPRLVPIVRSTIFTWR